MSNKKLMVIAGPTAVGKTELAIRLADHFRTEVISADSRQVYKELEIGTAKPSATELGRVRHHFVDFLSIDKEYDAGTYGHEARERIDSLFKTHETLILCGGSGLYIKAILEGFDDLPDIPVEVREKIRREYEANGLPWLQQEIETHDPDYYDVVDRQNPQRLMRATSSPCPRAFTRRCRQTVELDLETGLLLGQFGRRQR